MKPLFALFTTIFLWASAFVGIRFGLSVYSPGSLALFRFLLASLVIGGLYPLFASKQAIPSMDKLRLLLIGVLGIGVYNLCLNYGELTVSAGIASFLIGQIPILTLILSFFLLKEPVSLKSVPGILLSLLGVAIIAVADQSGFHWDVGVLLILISALVGAIYTVSQRRYLEKYHPVIITAWVIWGGALMLSIFSFDFYQEVKQSNWQVNLIVVYLGVFPATIAYIAWSYALSYMSAARASTFLYTMPLFSTLFGFVLLNERPTLLALLGGAIALGGALFSHYMNSKQRLIKAV